jgi:hypothetical protein
MVNMEREELYIGTKIIRAFPMTELTFLQSKGGPTPVQDDRPGYHVRYDNGYTSWSPKDVFESAYRLVTEPEMGLID